MANKFKTGRLRNMNGGETFTFPPCPNPDGWTPEEWAGRVSQMMQDAPGGLGFWMLALFEGSEPGEDAEPDNVGVLVVAPPEVAQLMANSAPDWTNAPELARQQDRPRRMGFDLPGLTTKKPNPFDPVN